MGNDGGEYNPVQGWLTRLSAKVDALTLAKISGHRDLSILLNAYYRETAADIAKKLG
ncbi:hypothetical protein JMK10_16285 [Rhodovulum sulfidophilum]|uniref:hypothetical protein n=1 Tax=Rhodovulum sulfidophilum TaxID=35806 RepID=UPI001924C82C|nr:hypothetical protein [Rhodovulum sulfidophilum]MBL3575740.1 hypothetical protein [Rhodovulum sulfidophilum]MCE8432264.1 hypothetical protein [Rhodovulum sulfidophilum]MCF4118324.1 hypothetical protein [Rhodovulum sulfidophilum]